VTITATRTATPTASGSAASTPSASPTTTRGLGSPSTTPTTSSTATSSALPGASPTTSSSGSTALILVKFKSSATQADIDQTAHGNGGRSVRGHNQIRTHAISVPAQARDAALNALRNNPHVERAELAVQRKLASVPNDASYSEQWALPKVGWDQAFG